MGQGFPDLGSKGFRPARAVPLAGTKSSDAMGTRDGVLEELRGMRPPTPSSLLAAFALVLGLLPGAADAPARSTAPDRLQEIAGDLSARWGAPVLVDPEIGPAAPSSRPDASLLPEESLRRLCAAMRGVAWCRVYLTPEERAILPPAARLAATARALGEVGLGGLVLENPATKRATRFQSDPPAPAEARAPGPALSREPVYLLYSTTSASDGKSAAARLLDLQRQQLQVPIAEERLALAMREILQLLTSLAPEARGAFIARTTQASQQVWEATPARERTEMIEQCRRLMERSTAPPPVVALPPASAPFPPLELRVIPVPPLMALAANLADRYRAPILVDPAIVVTHPPQDPGRDLPVEEALDKLAASLPGVLWRRLYLPAALLKPLKKTHLAVTLPGVVRALTRLETGSLLLESAGTRRRALYVRDQPVGPSLAAEMEAAGFAVQPIYLLYSALSAPRSGTPESRLAELQRQQVALMLAMTPETMATSMEGWIEAYRVAEAATRARILGLPIMAAMMAVWLPERRRREPKGDERARGAGSH
jgi:hypothetical protein